MSDNTIICHDGCPKRVMVARPKVTGMKLLVAKMTKAEVSTNPLGAPVKSSNPRIIPVSVRTPWKMINAVIWTVLEK